MKKQRNYDILKNFKREINLNTKVVKNKKKYNRKGKHKMNFKDFVSEGNILTDFQLENDNKIAGVNKTKDYIEVKYFQRYKISNNDKKEVEELAKKLNYTGSITQNMQTIQVQKS